MSHEPWLEELAAAFPGWLLPAAARSAIESEAAARFLSRLSGRSDYLHLLQAASLMVSQAEALARFVQEELPALVRVLPARTRVEHRTWEGGFHGRLDIRATLQLHEAGQPTRFVTRSRKRDLALPENILLVSVVRQLLRELDLLLAGHRAEGWFADLAVQAVRLRVLLDGSALQEIPVEPVNDLHVGAAQRAAHTAYHSAAWWHGRLRDAFDSRNPKRTAQLLADGALRPLTAPKRFELAVLVRLVARLSMHLLGAAGANRWKVEHALILPGRDEVVVFHRADGARIAVYYDSNRLPGGPRLRGIQHYLGTGAAQRPDISLCRTHPDGRERWAVIEVKCSDDRSYLSQGFDEALLYDHEYAAYLAGWPRSVLVCSADIPGAPRTEDSVIAVDWARWVPDDVLRGLIDELDGAG